MAKNYNRQLIRRKYIQSSTEVPQFSFGGNLKQFGNWTKDNAAHIATTAAGAALVAGGTLTLNPVMIAGGAGMAARGVSGMKTREDKVQGSATAIDSADNASIDTTASDQAAADAAMLKAHQEREAREAQSQTNINNLLAKPITTDNTNYNQLSTIAYRKGGLVKPKKFYMGGESTGTESNAPNAELEKAEPFMTPSGTISNVPKNAPTHEQGGVKMNIPEGTKIIGKQQDGSEELKEAGVRLAKLQKKFDKVIENRPTQVDRNTAERMIKNATLEFENLFMQQELSKMMAQQPMDNRPQQGMQQQMPVQQQNITQ